MNKYIEGVVENIERRGITKSLTLELSGKDRRKDVIFFEDIVSIKSNDGTLHSARVEDDNAVSVGDEVFLFKNDEDIAVKIYKEKEQLHKDLDTSISGKDMIKNNLKDVDDMLLSSIAFVICFFLMSLPFLTGCVLISFLSDSANKFMNNPDTGYAFFNVLLVFIGMITAFMFHFSCKKSLSDEKKEKERLQKMVDDFIKDQAEQGVEISQKVNVIVR